MKQTKSHPAHTVVLFLLILIVPVLACTQPNVSATRIAPNDLSAADLSYEQIRGQDLSGKIMQGANLWGSTILDSNFSGADLRNANLSDTLIRKTSFANADLRGANLDHACMDDNNIWTGALLDDKWAKYIAVLERGIEPGQDLRGYDLSNVCIWFDHLDKVNPVGGKLSRAKIVDSFLVGANLARGDLRNAAIYGSDLHDIDLAGANMEGAILSGNNLAGADLTDTKLRDATLEAAKLSGADLTGADLTGAKLIRVNLMGVIVAQEQLSTALLDCVRLPDGTLVPTCYGYGPQRETQRVLSQARA